jgi:hypothetical protein
MTRPDGTEVAVVERHDFRDVKALGDSDDSRIGRAEREVGVGLHELGHPRVVVVGEVDHPDRVLDDRAQERGLDACAACPAEEIAHFGDDRRGNEDLPSGEM